MLPSSASRIRNDDRPHVDNTLDRHAVGAMPGDQGEIRRLVKRTLPASSTSGSDDESLVERVKKCRVSLTPGELRLKKDLVECKRLEEEGIARIDRTVGNPLKCTLTFLRPLGDPGAPPVAERIEGGASAVHGDPRAGPRAGVGVGGGVSRIPTVFTVLVPKYYPHDPPSVYTNSTYSCSCPFVGSDGMVDFPFVLRGHWTSIQTMLMLVETLLKGLRRFAAGHAQPWGPEHWLNRGQGQG
ncbi:unnamed protein product, partial [Discosporangium mesarthrocarpum]